MSMAVQLGLQIDRWLSEGDFAAVKRFLFAVDVIGLEPPAISAVLMMTRSEKKELEPERAEFWARARERLASQWDEARILRLEQRLL